MKQYKYDFFNVVPPSGYRFVRYKEKYKNLDVWFRSDTGIEVTYTIRRYDINCGYDCNHNFPVDYPNYSAGYIRKLDEKI
jgi:hypothetical protein